MAATLSTPRRRVVSARHRIYGPFVPRGPDRVDDEDAVESGLGEDLGLTHVARGDSVGLRLDLAPTDVNAFVRLDVRPDVEAVLGGEALNTVDVVPHHVGRHDRRRSVDALDEGAECLLEPVHSCTARDWFAATPQCRPSGSPPGC